MSKQTKQFFEQMKNGEQPALADNIKEAASSLQDIGGQIWDGMKPMFDHGRTELAAALFAGHAHVMYMKGGHEGAEPQREQGQEQAQTQEAAERQSDGREM